MTHAFRPTTDGPKTTVPREPKQNFAPPDQRQTHAATVC